MSAFQFDPPPAQPGLAGSGAKVSQPAPYGVCGECGSGDLAWVYTSGALHGRKECRECGSTGPFVPRVAS